MAKERSTYGLITEEGLKKLKDMKGTKLRISMMKNNELACGEETAQRAVEIQKK